VACICKMLYFIFFFLLDISNDNKRQIFLKRDNKYFTLEHIIPKEEGI